MWQTGHGLRCLCVVCVQRLKVQQPLCIAPHHSCLEGSHPRAKEDRKDNPAIFIHWGCCYLIVFSSLFDVNIFLSPVLHIPPCFLRLHSRIVLEFVLNGARTNLPLPVLHLWSDPKSFSCCSHSGLMLFCKASSFSFSWKCCASHLRGERDPLYFSFKILPLWNFYRIRVQAKSRACNE